MKWKEFCCSRGDCTKRQSRKILQFSALAGRSTELAEYPHYLYVSCCCGKTMQNTFKEFQFQSLRALLFLSILVKIHNLFARFFLLALRAWLAFNSERMTVQKALWHDLHDSRVIPMNFRGISDAEHEKSSTAPLVNVNFPHCNNDLVASKIWFVRGLINFIWSIMNLWDCQPRNPQRADYPRRYNAKKFQRAEVKMMLKRLRD